MKITLVDFLYTFNDDTPVEVVNPDTKELIFSGYAGVVIRDINSAYDEFSIDLGSYNYAEIERGKLVIYPDIE